MEQPNESQKRKIDETAAEAPKVEATGEPSAKKAKVETEEITPAKIKKQIEYYFSDSNYRRDKWLQEEAAKNPEGFIEIAKIAAFPRLQAMTTDLNVVVELMRSSDRLTVSEDGLLVKRSQPLPAVDNSHLKTVFVKGLPEDATIDSVEAVFSQFGAVARIIIFRERETKKAKGEACVEFETEEGSKAAAAAAKLDLDGREISITPKKEHKEKAARDHKEKRDKREKTEEELQQEAEAAEERKKAKEERIERMKGTVLHVTFTGEEGQEFSSDFNKWDVKALFEEIVSTENIRFVDFAAKNAWVRMTSPEPAQKALAELTANPKEVKGVKFTNVRLLEGDEEMEYIDKVMQEGDRKASRGGRGGGRGDAVVEADVADVAAGAETRASLLRRGSPSARFSGCHASPVNGGGSVRPDKMALGGRVGDTRVTDG
ncbi:RNA binding motif containing protein [Acanthamoeba castellanii str. Neff]|uniref:RNA binding motif containing protein n=1 Tax=Acanthamoeba castellanii (strain ATCC 30010 / Neff) TaxID=1257118 RepID=L8GM55_ACACF|nr:RNA binding motif containing protein [Acanthamoeba castellanii str. Neff]ELR13833.1 RNA binding motif containing protein [Acanthamoeba castellanii str. Neff]